MSYLHCPTCKCAYNIEREPACPRCGTSPVASADPVAQLVAAAEQLARVMSRANPEQLAAAHEILQAKHPGLLAAPAPAPPPTPVRPIAPRLVAAPPPAPTLRARVSATLRAVAGAAARHTWTIGWLAVSRLDFERTRSRSVPACDTTRSVKPVSMSRS